MSIGFWQILLIVVMFMLLFGRGKVPQLMGDIAEGIKNFRTGIRDDAEAGNNVASARETTPPPQTADHLQVGASLTHTATRTEQ